MKLINHFIFFNEVIHETIKLSNDQDADVFCSWKVGGQDFYAYGIKVTGDKNEHS